MELLLVVQDHFGAAMVFADRAVDLYVGVAERLQVADMRLIAFEGDDVELALFVFDLRGANVEVADAGVLFVHVIDVGAHADVLSVVLLGVFGGNTRG